MSETKTASVFTLAVFVSDTFWLAGWLTNRFVDGFPLFDEQFTEEQLKHTISPYGINRDDVGRLVGDSKS